MCHAAWTSGRRLLGSGYGAAVLALLVIVQMAVLNHLPYSSSLIETGTLAEAGSPPRGSVFRVGSVLWDGAAFATNPALDPYRLVFKGCSERDKGIKAAVRVSNEFATRFRHGDHAREFLFRTYDPAQTLADHMRGESGHCVSRAGLVATTLLSVGIPARVLQVQPPGGPGHNIVEVWDESEGWVAYDPTTGAAFTLVKTQDSPATYTLLSSSHANAGFALKLIGKAAEGTGPADKWYSPEFFQGDLIYPEPWLYTRVGPRFSYWPFGGKFVQVGSGSWGTTRARLPIRAGVLVCLSALIAQAGATVYRAFGRRKSRQSSWNRDGTKRRNWSESLTTRLRPHPPDDSPVGGRESETGVVPSGTDVDPAGCFG